MSPAPWYNGSMPKTPAKRKPKKVNYSPLAVIKPMVKSITARAAMEPEIIRVEDLKRRAIKLHIRGRDHEFIARRLHITTQEAHQYIREKVKDYIEHESFDPAEVREIIAKRYDSPLALAAYEAFPHPMKDEFGRPVMGNVCDCELPEGCLCLEEGHVAQKMTRANLDWMKVYLEVLNEQKKMYGVDAADKMKQKTVDILERTYKGVSAAVIDNL